jgi:hypothetical protein
MPGKLTCKLADDHATITKTNWQRQSQSLQRYYLVAVALSFTGIIFNRLQTFLHGLWPGAEDILQEGVHAFDCRSLYGSLSSSSERDFACDVKWCVRRQLLVLRVLSVLSFHL